MLRGPGEQLPWRGGWPQSLSEFECLVAHFQHRLVRHAHRILHDQNEAEEIAQEVLVRAFRDRSRRRDVANVTAYLYRMSGNLCADLLRERKRHPASLDRHEPVDQAVRLASDRPDPLDGLAAREEEMRIERLLSLIPRDQAEVLRLRFLDELSVQEISEVLRRPEATVKSRLRYGLEKLRQRLARETERPS